MKVVQINAVYGHGSTGVIVRNLEGYCEQANIESYVVSPDPKVKEAKRGYVLGNIFDHKIHALFSRINDKQAYFSYQATQKLLAWMDNIKPDIVHLHNLHSNYIHLNILLEYLAKKNIGTVITLHDCWFFTGGCFHYTSLSCSKWQEKCIDCPRKNHSKLLSMLDRSSKILEDRKEYLSAIPRLTIIGASKWIADECKKSVLRNCTIDYIHNGFNLDIFKPVSSDFRQRFGLEDKYIILAPASKWHLDINLPAFNYFVSKMHHDMILVLFGCKKFHKDLPSNVIEIGYINDVSEMVALYSMADVFVNCTYEDTFPSVNIECQATGTPIVTYDGTGCKETVDGICGKAVPVGNYRQLFNSVLEIKKIGKNKLSKECMRWVYDNFELHQFNQKYLDLYKQIYANFQQCI